MIKHLKKAILITTLLGSSMSYAAEPEKEWNFLVFINGVNNLDPFGTTNINQMEEVGSNASANIIVQWGSYNRKSVDRLLIQKDSNTRTVTSPVVKSLGQVDMGDWKNLVEFVRWAQAEYPARRTFLTVWNHGSGWHRITNIFPSDISNDDRTGNSIKTEELGLAMKEIRNILGRNIDIYGSDACLMGMVEVAEEMSGAVDYFVGSQDLEPGEGWPYNKFLQKWFQNLNQPASEVVKVFSKEFLTAYSGGIYGRQSVTMSAFDMGYLEAYNQAIRSVAQELSQLPANKLAVVKRAMDKAKFFDSEDYRDLLDFVNEVKAAGVSLSSAEALTLAHKNLVIANDQNQDTSTHGVSVWLPTQRGDYKEYAKRYAALSFNQKTDWMNFLSRIYPN